jgi:hypothetical protein
VSKPERVFVRLAGGGYALTSLRDGVRIEVRHLRRERHQLHGEVEVSSTAKRIDGATISCQDLNLSSQTAVNARAEYCAKRAQVHETEFDWHGFLDECCLQVIRAERAGSDPIVLDDAPTAEPRKDFAVHGLSIPSDSHSLLVCDGDGLKSLTLLLVLGEMAKRGIPVAYLDWEWNAARHKRRKERSSGPIELINCSITAAAIRSSSNRITSAGSATIRAFNSSASTRSVRPVRGSSPMMMSLEPTIALDHLPPSLAAAHVPKNVDGSNDAAVKPFGSAFFSNYTRMSWKLKKQVGASDDLVTVLYTPGKQNDGERRKPVCLEFAFTPECIDVRHVDPTTVDGFVQTLPLHARLTHLLKGGPMTIHAMADALDAKVDSITKAVNRGEGQQFVCVPGKDGIDRWGLLERRAS